MKKCRLFIILLSAVFFALFLAGCSGNGADAAVYENNTAAPTAAGSETDKALYVCPSPREQLKRISGSSAYVLYLDEKTLCVSVYDTNSKKLWRGLPEVYCGEKPSVVSVDVVCDGRVITFNSQADSVAKKNALYELHENAVTVVYGFRKTLDNGTQINLNVPVDYSVKDGNFTVSVNCENLLGDGTSPNVAVKSVSVLNYFGSGNQGESGDFVFVPDGCGTILDAEKKAESFTPVKIPVYGADYAAKEADGKYCAYVPCFGIKKAGSAFAATVESADADCFITASRATVKGGYHRAGAGFNITKTFTNAESGKTYVSGQSYRGELRLSYRFLSGDGASYSGMASACREALIRNGVLSFSATAEQTGMPFVLTVPAAAQTQDGNDTVLTTFDEAQELLSVFRGKGISNIWLRYRGMFTGGLRQSSASSLSFSQKLGTKKQLQSLLDYADSQSIRVFADINLLSAKPGEWSRTAVSLDSSAAVADIKDLPSASFSAQTQRELIAGSELEDETNTLLSFARSLDLPGLCVSDAGQLLYSDFSRSNPFSRHELRDAAANQCAAVSSSKQLMVNGSNLYALKYASAVVNLADTSALSQLDGCTQIPFLQILLHGLTHYSGTPINLTKNTDSALLKAAEYGAVPSFALYYANFGTDKKADVYHYMNFAADAQLAYERMRKVFSDLGDKTVTAHYKVKSGVYCTEYGAGISVYVNYNKKDVTVNGVTIAARDFVRVG